MAASPALAAVLQSAYEPAPTGLPEYADDSDLLALIAQGLGSPTGLESVLHEIAYRTMVRTGADHVSLLSLAGRYLHPAASIGRNPELDPTPTLAALGAIEVDPERWSLFANGRIITIPSTARSQLIPPGLTQKFTDHAVAMVALHAGGEPCGLLALDWVTAHDFDSDELLTLQRMGAYSAVAVGAARPYDAVRRQGRLHAALARGSAQLVALTNPAEIVTALADLYAHLLSPRSWAVATLDTRLDGLGALAASTSEDPPLLRLADIPPDLVELLNDAWSVRPEPVEVPANPWLATMFGQRVAELLAERAKRDPVDDGAVAGFEAQPQMRLADLVGIDELVRRQCQHNFRIAAAERTGAIEHRDQLRRHRARADGAIDEQLVGMTRLRHVVGERAFDPGAEFRQPLFP